MNLAELLSRAQAKGYCDLSILNDSVVGFYKTHSIKYKNKKGFEESYFFPTTFSLKEDNVITSMLLGCVSKDFQIPYHSEIENAIRYGVNLKIIDVENHTYKHLIAQETSKIPEGRLGYRFIHPKTFGFIILGLSSVGFPFIQIPSKNSLED